MSYYSDMSQAQFDRAQAQYDAQLPPEYWAEDDDADVWDDEEDDGR